MALGRNIKARREVLGLAQERLAERAGMSQAALSALERRDSRTSEFLIPLAKELGVTPTELITGIIDNNSSVSAKTLTIPEDMVGEIIKDAGYEPVELARLITFFQQHFPGLEEKMSRERYVRLILTAAKGQKTESGLPGADWISKLVLLARPQE